MPNSQPQSLALSALYSGRRVFGSFLLQRLLGRGGIGDVWLAEDEKHQRLVAVKFFQERISNDAKARAQLRQEIRRSRELAHPNIARIYEFVEDSDFAGVSMEYLDGSTLAQLQSARPNTIYEVDDLKEWASALCSALDYAHEARRCVHHNLKPSNIFIDAQGILKIAEFGVGAALDERGLESKNPPNTQDEFAIRSPQQIAGEVPTSSDDIYSLGATFYALLTGQPPFLSGEVSASARDIAPPTITARRSSLKVTGAPVPPAWEKTIATCLATSANDRPQRARDIALLLGLPILSTITLAPPLGEDHASPPVIAPATPSSELDVVAPGTLKPVTGMLVRHRWPIVAALALAAFLVPYLLVKSPEPVTSLPVTPAVANFPSPFAAQAQANTKEEPQETARSLSDGAFLATTSPAPPPPVPQDPPARLEVVTVPPGIPFQITESAFEMPDARIIYSGETPAPVEQLPAGVYRITFSPEGTSPRSESLEIPATGMAHHEQTFPHGVVSVTSQPPGAEILSGNRPMGTAPAELALLPGKHEIGAVWEGRSARLRTVNIEAGGQETINFDFRSSNGNRSRPRRSTRKEDDSVWEKMGRSINRLFSGDKKR